MPRIAVPREWALGPALVLAFVPPSCSVTRTAATQERLDAGAESTSRDEPGLEQSDIGVGGSTTAESTNASASSPELLDAGSAFCEGLPECTGGGLCTLEDGACVATSDERCQKADACRIVGKCHRVGKVCRATTAGDCERSEMCRDAGLCVLRGCSCFPSSALGCNVPQGLAARIPCKHYGRCSVEGPACIAASDSDCAQSEVCTFGFCTAFHGTCLSPDVIDSLLGGDSCDLHP